VLEHLEVEDEPPGEVSARRARGLSALLREPGRPEWLRRHPKAHLFALGTVCIGAFMGQLDASIVTVALPSLQRAFDASVGAVTWVGLSYLLVLVTMVTAVGRVADTVGRKLLYSYGFVVFTLGSGLCALAPSLLSLDLFRVLQALGAAMLQANSVAIIYLALPKESLGRGIGVQGAAQALGLALGPAVGGALLAAGGWRLIFSVNVPVGIVAIVASRFLLPRSRHLQASARFDWLGLVLFVPATAALLLAVSYGDEWGWASPAILVLLVTAVAAAIAFVRRERSARDPLLDLTLFERPAFSIGIAGGVLAFVVLFGVLFVIPFFLEHGRHLSPAGTGLELAALPLALGLTAPFAGRLADRVGPRPLTVSGMAISAAVLAVVGLTRPATGPLVAALALLGVGAGLFIAPNSASVMASAPKVQAGVASGVLNMSRGTGTALGLALTGLVYTLAGATGTAHVPSGFSAAAFFLAAVAAAAAVLTALERGARRPAGAPAALEL